MANLFYENNDITSIAQLIQILTNNEMDYLTLNDDITPQGLNQIHIYIDSNLKQSIHSNIIIQMLNDMTTIMDESYDNKDCYLTVQSIYKELLITTFIENIK